MRGSPWNVLSRNDGNVLIGRKLYPNAPQIGTLVPAAAPIGFLNAMA
jgi:hypothetical protein